MSKFSSEQYKKQIKDTLQMVLGCDSLVGKRAAIMTWCNNNGPTNYGQILQCYATQKILKDFGMEPVTILYQKIPAIAQENDIVRVQRFQQFINQHITVTKPCLTKEMVEEETADCDLLLCGSDQIWNPMHYDPMYFLDFGTDQQKRIAFSVSGIFWDDEKTNQYVKGIASSLEKLDYISVRERCGADILKKYTTKDVFVLPDPTMILPKEEWLRVINADTKGFSKNFLGEDYILCYFLGKLYPYEGAIMEVAEQCNIDNVYYIPSNLITEEHLNQWKPITGCGPIEFLSVVQGAKAVVTDSFHGVIFSALFEKTIYCADRLQDGKDDFGGRIRVENLQEMFGLNFSRLYPKPPIANMNQIFPVLENGETPLVSIVVPVYNAEAYLSESLNDILSQTYRNIELICVDDGSTDKSGDILDRYARKDMRMTIVHQNNQHAGVARNIGFVKSKGKYVIFLDADDRFHIDLVEKMVAQAEQTEADIVICDIEGFDDKTSEIYRISGTSLDENALAQKEFIQKEDIKKKLFTLTAGWAWDKIYRSDFLRQYKLKFLDTRTAEDAYFVYCAYMDAERIAIVKDVLISHRMYISESLESTRSDTWMDSFYMLFHLKEEIKKRNASEVIEKGFINYAGWYIIFTLVGIDDKKTLEDFLLFYRDHIDELLNLDSSIGVFDDEFIYDLLLRMKNDTSVDLLIWMVNRLYLKKDKDVFRLQYILKCMDTNITAMNKHIEVLNRNKMWRFPKDDIPTNTKIAVYGYGDVGKDYCDYILSSKEYQLVLVIDKNYREFKKEKFVVSPVEALTDVRYDVLLIAVASETVAKEAKEHLLGIGVEESKILWLDPTVKWKEVER